MEKRRYNEGERGREEIRGGEVLARREEEVSYI